MTKIVELSAVRQERAAASDRAELTRRFPGLNFIDKNGKLYVYHRATKTAIKAPIGSPEFQAAYDAAEGKTRERPKPGTLAECFAAFRETRRFKGLAARTRREYEDAMRWAQRAAEVIQITNFTPRDVIAMLDRCAEVKWFKFANDLYCVLKLALDEAVIDQVIAVNPARVKGVSKISRPKHLPTANRVWFPDERKAVLDEATGAIEVVVGVAMFTGMRHGDVLDLTEADYDGVCVRFAQNKTAQPMKIPVHPRLKAILDPLVAARRKARAAGLDIDPRLVLGVNGQPYTETGFHTMWQRFIRRLKQEGKVGQGVTLHGLRHSAGTYLAEAGMSQETIKALLGHKSFRASHIYTAQAKQDRLIATAVENLYPEDRERDGN